MVDAYPLQWPVGWPITPNNKKKRAAFQTTLARARDGVIREARLLKGHSIVISTNIPVRKDGELYYRYREPDDPGVAVYFIRDGKEVCVPCDKWDKVNDNLHAVELSISALRGLDRWGAKTMVDAAFRGFEALPAHDESKPDTVFAKHDYFTGCKTVDEIRKRRRKLSLDMHPDKEGNQEEFTEMMRQYEKKIEELR